METGLVRLDAGVLWDGYEMVRAAAARRPEAAPRPLIHLNSEAVKTRMPGTWRSAAVAPEFLRNAWDLNDQMAAVPTALFKREMKALAACRMTLGFGTVGSEAVTRRREADTSVLRAWLAHGAKPARQFCGPALS
jgi:hypothetical protein